MRKQEANVAISNCNLIKERQIRKCKNEVRPRHFSQLPSVVGSVVVDASGRHMLAPVKCCCSPDTSNMLLIVTVFLFSLCSLACC